MKALVKLHPEPGLWLQNVPKPEPKPHEVLIKVKLAAICGTDLHIFQWDNWAQENITPPVTVGHEFVGTIVETGSQVTGLTIGTRVVGEGHIVCGTCRNCRAGRNHHCRATQGVGIHRNGGFAEYVAIPAANAYSLPDSISDETAAILDPLGNAVHTALSFGLVGEDVLITGGGPIGQMAAAICRHAGARHIVITDLEDRRLQTAKKMGATRAVNPTKESLTDIMSELNMTEGFDIALEMSGSPAALADLIKHTVHGGKVGLLGIFSQSTLVDLNQVIFKGLTIKGIYGREMFDTWYKAVAMLNSGLDVSPIISHRFPLDNYQQAFTTLESGQASKILLKIG